MFVCFSTVTNSLLLGPANNQIANAPSNNISLSQTAFVVNGPSRTSLKLLARSWIRLPLQELPIGFSRVPSTEPYPPPHTDYYYRHATLPNVYSLIVYTFVC